METLKVNDLAYYHNPFYGFVKVKVIEIIKENKIDGEIKFDLGYGGDMVISTEIRVIATVTDGPYKKGELLRGNGTNIIPRKSVRNIKNGNAIIKPYKISS